VPLLSYTCILKSLNCEYTVKELSLIGITTKLILEGHESIGLVLCPMNETFSGADEVFTTQ